MASAPQPYSYAVLVVLSLLSGVFSGLNLGLMSLTVEDLNIIIASSTDQKKVRNAKRILPLRKRGNLLLCTLLIGNTVVNVLLAVVTDPIWRYAFGDGIEGQVLSLVIPSAIIVLLGEIIPQSVCSRYALEVGAASLPLTYVFVILILPCSIPIALLLDRLLGAEIGSVYTREGLMQLVKLNVESAAHAKESGLTSEDARLLGGALTFRDRTVGEVMTPIERVYMLPIDTVLDRDAFLGILERGHTRIPVYDGDRANIVAVLLAKNLLGIGHAEGVTLTYVVDAFRQEGCGGRVLRVPAGTRLNAALSLCKRARTHLLVVTSDEATSDGLLARISAMGSAAASAAESWESQLVGTGPVVGIATVEDFLEEILQDEIVDETDVYIDNTGEITVAAATPGRDGTPPPESGVASAGRALPRRLNSKHIDSSVVLRQLTATGSVASNVRDVSS